MDNITWICRKCGQELPLSEFVKNKRYALGHEHTCKQCRREYQCKWDAENAEKVLEKRRKRYAANHEKALEYGRKYRAANPEKAREYSRKYRAANREKRREYGSKYHAANREKVLEKHRYKREILSDGYLRDQLKQRNLPIIPETIEYKRIQLKLYREIKNQQTHERD